MAYDIYGEHLRPGHCEVHPQVHETYPCSVCFSENYQRYFRKVAYREAEAAHLARLYDEHITEQTEGLEGEGI